MSPLADLGPTSGLQNGKIVTVGGLGAESVTLCDCSRGDRHRVMARARLLPEESQPHYLEGGLGRGFSLGPLGFLRGGSFGRLLGLDQAGPVRQSCCKVY